jgi:conjugative relaxase-like TrwC/TraI family protein
MLNVEVLSYKQASTYYSKGKDNYYTETQGEFIGKLKDALNLGDLTHEAFESLLRGVNPTTGQSLIASKGGREKDVPAFDFALSASKSVSLALELALQKGDTALANAIQTAHDSAVNSTILHIEKEEIQIRKQKNKIKTVEKTGNIVGAKFQHDIGRDLDPQLHTHTVIFNFSKCSDGKYRTLHSKGFLTKSEDNPFIKNIGKLYREILRENLEKAGFELRDTDRSQSFYELKSIDDNLIQAFSSRSLMIRAKTEELRKLHPHLSEAQLSKRAFFDTRKTKNKEVDRDEVRLKNVELMSKHVNLDKLLSSLQPKKLAQKEQIQEPKIEQAELKKIINEAKSEIQNKKHRTPLNVTIKAAAKIDTPISITTLFNQVKNEEVRQQKQLNTMHEVLLNSLKSTKLDTLKLFESLKNTPKILIEEKFENARARTPDYRARLAASYSDITDAITRAKQSHFRDATDLITTTERGEPRAELERDGVTPTRGATTNDRPYVITAEELRRDDQIAAERLRQKQNQGQER